MAAILALASARSSRVWSGRRLKKASSCVLARAVFPKAFPIHSEWLSMNSLILAFDTRGEAVTWISPDLVARMEMPRERQL